MQKIIVSRRSVLKIKFYFRGLTPFFRPLSSLPGELLAFDDSKTCLLAIDRLDGFLPSGHTLHRRGLAPVSTQERTVPAWVVLMSEHNSRLAEDSARCLVS